LDITQLLVIAIVQGITEFIPISSSGHLILIPALTGWPDQGLPIDVAVHIGTLGAVLVYFWREVGALLKVFARPVGPVDQVTPDGQNRRLFYCIAIATVPIVIIGGIIWTLGETEALRSVYLVAFDSIFWGILLYVADRFARSDREIKDLTFLQALLVGLAQCLSLLPGTSRSGITMTVGRFLGLKRTEAANFSFLMSIPAILIAGVAGVYEVIQLGNVELEHDALISGSIAFVAGLGAIAFLLDWLKRHGMLPFVIYRVALGVALLIWAAYQ
jgi:undecaprenyl-diphosphatase